MVVVEREGEKSLLDRGLMCAGLVAGWKPDFFFRYPSSEHATELSRFLEVPVSDLNRTQRVILVAESHEFAVYSAAQWLAQHYGIEIQCVLGRIDGVSGFSLSPVGPETYRASEPAVDTVRPVVPRISIAPGEDTWIPAAGGPLERSSSESARSFRKFPNPLLVSRPPSRPRRPGCGTAGSCAWRSRCL
jgi:hypothetical protein